MADWHLAGISGVLTGAAGTTIAKTGAFTAVNVGVWVLVTDAAGNNEHWARKAKYLTTQAKDDPLEYVHEEIGYNYRLTNVQAAIGCAQLEQLAEFVSIKRHIAGTYSKALKDLPGITLMREASWAYSTFWMQTVLVDREVCGVDSRGLTRVMVSGDSIVQAQPDTANLAISVVTQGKRAIEAQQENANRTDSVVRALKAAAGAGAEIKTSGYSVQPQRAFKENQPPTITGYEARNTVMVRMGDLTKVGAVIDAAVQAGANDVESVSFTLRKDRPARDQALAEATRAAVSKAQVISSAP